MRRLASIFLVVTFSGCLLFDDSGGKTCQLTPTGGDVASPPPAQRDPQTLNCQSFGSTCNPMCGPCPALAIAMPTWGFCSSSCEGVDETSCAMRSDCRVVKDARCAVAGNCITDFLGCFPTDMLTDPTIDCARVTDGDSCSRSNACTALHRNDPCPLATDAVCPRPFAMCIPEGGTPGLCFAPVTCDAVTPICATGSTPGVDAGCFTGVCIPDDLCEPPPP